jgi:hypothetical protein
MLDGTSRGDVMYLQATVGSGSHQLAYRGLNHTQRLLVRVEPGRVTRVSVSASGESAITMDQAPNP